MSDRESVIAEWLGEIFPVEGPLSTLELGPFGSTSDGPDFRVDARGELRVTLGLISWERPEPEASRTIRDLKEQECRVAGPGHTGDLERLGAYLRAWGAVLERLFREPGAHEALLMCLPCDLCYPRLLDTKMRTEEQFLRAFAQPSRLRGIVGS